MIEIVAIGAIALIQLAVGLRLRRVAQAASVFQYCRITPEEPWLPDAAIRARKPVVFHLPEIGKDLYLQPLAIAPHRLLMKRFAIFFGKYLSTFQGVPILTGRELDNAGALRTSAEQIANLFDAKPDMTRDALALVELAFLKDRRMNPHRVRRRHLEKCGIDTLAALWLRARERNVDCVRDFIESLLVQLQAGNQRSTAGSGSGASAEYLSKIRQPTPYRVPFYWQNGSRSEERGKSMSERLKRSAPNASGKK